MSREDGKPTTKGTATLVLTTRRQALLPLKHSTPALFLALLWGLTAMAGNLPANLKLYGPATEILLDLAFAPGQPVAALFTASQAAREKGERLPDRVTVAILELAYADGRHAPAQHLLRRKHRRRRP